jgi:hypothetical protein
VTHPWRNLLIILALGASACDSTKADDAPSPSPERAVPDDDARRKRAEAIVANAKAREASTALDEVELSDEEEAKIRAAAAAEIDESNLAAEVNALEIRLNTELTGAPPEAGEADAPKGKKKGK